MQRGQTFAKFLQLGSPLGLFFSSQNLMAHLAHLREVGEVGHQAQPTKQLSSSRLPIPFSTLHVLCHIITYASGVM